MRTLATLGLEGLLNEATTEQPTAARQSRDQPGRWQPPSGYPQDGLRAVPRFMERRAPSARSGRKRGTRRASPADGYGNHAKMRVSPVPPGQEPFVPAGEPRQPTRAAAGNRGIFDQDERSARLIRLRLWAAPAVHLRRWKHAGGGG
jgi:hypothetical protein